MTTYVGRFQNLAKPSVDWAVDDPILLLGEFGISNPGSSDPTIKVGDGVRPFSALPGIGSGEPGPPGTTDFANPTGTIGLTAVNGVLTTALRSDAAPALSQAIEPIWTGVHQFSGTLAGGFPTTLNGIAPALSAVGDPAICFRNQGAGTNSKNWSLGTSPTAMVFALHDDAGINPKSFAQFVRLGGAVASLQFGNPVDNPDFTFQGTGIASFVGTTLFGLTTPATVLAQVPAVQQFGATGPTSGRLQVRGSNDATGVQYVFGKTRATVLDGSTPVQSGDVIAAIHFAGADGSDFELAASIVATVAGAVTADNVPGDLRFHTAAIGGGGTGERFRISPYGGLGIGGANYGTAGQVFTSGGAAAAPSWSTISVTAGSVTGGAALTKTDDTNVTLTLGGTHAAALLAAASLTLGWTGTLAVARGGSGAATLTGYLKGNGTAAFTASATIPYSDIASAPAAANPTGTIGLTAVNGAATTYLRSDGAPALSQAIVPTWTGAHTFNGTVDLAGPLEASGAEGLPGQVLAAQGAGLPATWRSAGSGSIDLTFKFSTAVGGADPGNQFLALNSAVYASVTSIVFDEQTSTNFEAATILGLLRSGNRIYLQQSDDSTKAAIYEVTGPATDNGTYWTVPVSFINQGSSSAMFGSSKVITAVFILSSSSISVANPTATIGLTAVNGSAATAMRSDAAPALSQAIVPTWTGQHTFSALITQLTNAGGPVLKLTDTDAGTDATNWRVRNNGGTFIVSTENDAGTEVGQALNFTRAAAVISAMNFGNATHNPTSTFLGTGIHTVGGVYRGPAGSAAIPMLSATGDPDTGIYLPGSDTVAIASAGVLTAAFVGGLLTIGDGIVGTGDRIRLRTSAATGASSFHHYINVSATVLDFYSYDGSSTAVGTAKFRHAQVQLADGTAGAPVVSWTSDPDIGLFRQAANVIGVALAGVERVRFSSGSIPLRVMAADTVGDCLIGFYEPDATTQKGYVGYGGSADDTLHVWNAENSLIAIGTNNTLRATVAADGGVFMAGATGSSQGAGTINATGLYVNGVAVGGSVAAANPTGTIGLTAVNGSAATFLRSDGAPALSQAIVPTWSGIHTFSVVPVVPNDSWTYAKIQNVSATSRVLGRITSGAGDIEELTSANLVTILGSSIATGANPTGTIGLTAVNGSAATFLRSDGAPALSVTISPSWSGTHTFTGTHSTTGGPVAFAHATSTGFSMHVTGQAADGKVWLDTATSNTRNWNIYNDAGSAGKGYMSVARAANVVSSMTFGNAVDNPTFTFLGTGAVSAASFTTTSARAVKRETGAPRRAADILARLRPILYRLLEGNDSEQLGLIAEEVREVCPQLSDGERVSYDRLAILLLADWQERHAAAA